MNSISHFLDKEDRVVIEATIGCNTFATVIRPRIISGKAYIPASLIDTQGLENPEEMKKIIISYITSCRGKYNEEPVVVENK